MRKGRKKDGRSMLRPYQSDFLFALFAVNQSDSEPSCLMKNIFQENCL
jgi:hypothetical protein